MASSAISVLRGSDPYEQLISNMLLIEREPQWTIKDEKANQERLKGVMKDADSKISALHTLLKRFTDVISNPFEGRTAAVGSDVTAFSISATDTASLGSHTLKVDRLATTDARLSKQLTSSGTSLVSTFGGKAQTFKIFVQSPTDSDPNNRVGIDVSVTPAGTTDKAILDEVSTAIRKAMDDAVADGTIKTSDAANASVISENSTTARLSLRSGRTGYAGRLDFTDSADGLLAALDLTNAAVYSGTGGGQVTAIGTADDSLLDSKFMLDGLTLTRSTNQVSDALTGVTIQLKQVSTDPANFSVEPAGSQIQNEVNDFIKKYNDILSFIQTKSSIDGDAGTRGDLANDSLFTGLRYGMRTDLVKAVAGQPAGGPSMITDLGITIEKDGTLKLSNAEKLIAAVKENPGAVQSLFSAEDGIATRLKERLDQFVGINGFIKGRQNSLDAKIKNLDSRIKDWDERLTAREDQLRAQFAQLQSISASVQSQQAYLNNFFYR